MGSNLGERLMCCVEAFHAKPLVMLLVGKILKKKTYGQICSDL